MKELEVALKRDMKELEVAFKQDLKELEVAFKQDMDLLRRDMKELELRLSIRLGTIMAAGIAAIAVLMKLFPH
ncbi:MAG: hypothetical protein HQL04_05580 [Nitrospirae bacterium]|nr:hypothetical protein [Nitrospirota bacterium]